MARVSVIGQEVFSYHGCHPLEKSTGGRFEVDVHIDVDFTEAIQSDDVSFATDYVLVMEIVKSQMDIRSNLIETAAKNIMDALWLTFNKASRIEVCVRKLQPPVTHVINNVSVTIVEENQRNK